MNLFFVEIFDRDTLLPMTWMVFAFATECPVAKFVPRVLI